MSWLTSVVSWHDGDRGDGDYDDDGPREADLEGRVEKYIGVKVKVCVYFSAEMWIQNFI
jgi:hypothetical protein